MRKFKKMLSVLIVAAIMLTSFVPAFAASQFTYEAQARTLYELGLLKGVSTDPNVFDPALDLDMNRQEGIIMMLRLVGKIDTANAISDEEANQELSKYEDGANVEDWARKGIAYAVKNDLVIGTSETTLSPLDSFLGKMYATTILRNIGYEIDAASYEVACATLQEKGGLSAAEAIRFNDKELIRDDFVGMSFGSLKAVYAETEKTIIETLVAEGKVDRVKAENAGLIAPVVDVLDVKSVEAITNNKVNVNLNKAITKADASKFAVKDAAGAAVVVKSVSLSQDGLTVTVTTDALTPYAAYSLTAGTVTKQFVALAIDSTKPTATAVVTGNTTVEVTFSEEVDKAAAENIANYAVDNSLTVLKAALDTTNGTKATLTTSEQTVGSIYNLTIQNVTDVAGNAIEKTEALFGGMAKDTTKPTAAAVVTGNTTVEVAFNEKVDKAAAENVANYSIDNNLVVLKATLNTTNGTKVTLTTGEQTVGSIYKLTIQNVTDVAGNAIEKTEALFGGMAKDTTKPTASAVVTGNTTVEVTFNEKADKALAENVANYTVDNSLVVLKATLDTTNGTKVTLTTSEQAVGTIYKLTIQNVADVSGNVIEKTEVLFGGMAKDTTAPVVNTVTSSANTVVLTFNEKVNEATAEDVFNYTFDGLLGYASSATLDANGTVVTLKTAAQEPGKVYNVTVKNVEDVAGNVITEIKKPFVGIGTTATSELKVQALVVVNENTIDVMFDKDLAASDVAALAIAINKDNGVAYSSPEGLAYATTLQTNKKIARIQFKTTASTNPALFAAGHVYEATITGPANLVVADSANVKAFAGTNVVNAVPYITTATAINNTAIKVTFSEPVTNVAAGAFSFDNGISATGVSVTSDAKVTEALVYINPELTVSTIYTVTVAGTITDAAAYNTVDTTKTVKFAGINTVNAAPKITAIIPVDKYNFEILFNEAVDNAAAAVYSVTYEANSQTANLDLTNAKYVASTDKTKVSVKLDSTKANLVSGTIYELTYTAGSIVDLQGLAYDITTGANKVKFAGVDTVNAAAVIVAVDATGTTIKVTMSEDIYGFTTQTNLFDITVNGSAVTPSAATISGKVITFTVSQLTSGQSGTIKVNTTGAAAITDANNQAPKTDVVTFGTR